MRRDSTEAEDRLWQELRGRRLDNIKFRRQVPVGRFIADFVCAEARLIVEIDGSQHAESRHVSALRADPPSPTRGEGEIDPSSLQPRMRCSNCRPWGPILSGD